MRPVLLPMLLTAFAAAAAWGLAHVIAGHKSPIFAPIAAIIATGATVGRRGRQAIELVIGIVFGIVVAELVVYATGKGTWQIGLAVLAGLLVPTALGLPRLVATQAAVWGVLVVALPSGGAGHPALNRLIDGLIGAATALVLVQLLFPLDPIRLYRGAAREVRDSLADALDEVARGLRTGDRERVESALDTIDAIDQRRLYDAVALARDVARRAPRRRHARGRLAPAEAVAHELSAAAAEARGLATGSLRLIDIDAAREDAADAVAAVAAAIRTADHSVKEHADRARAAARRVRDGSSSLGASVVVHAVDEIARHAERSVRVREENERKLAETR